MADNSNLLSTPEGYATPDQIKSAREYAKALMTGNGQQPVKHWTQGVSNMVAALIGGNLDYQTGQKERAMDQYDTKNLIPQVGGAPAGSPATSPAPVTGDAPLAPTKTASADSDNLLDRSAGAISSVESGGDYGSLGPVLAKGSYAGDRAYGKYQVMGRNIPEWSQEVLGKTMTPQEFLKDREAQDSIFKAKFGQSVAKYGNANDAASVWFTGKPQAQGGNRSDGYITGNQYVSKFAKALGPTGDGGGEAGPALAFNGPDAQPPAAAAVTAAALRGQPVASKSVPGVAPTKLPEPAEGGGKIYVDPALVPKTPQYSEEQIRNVLSSQRIPWEEKQKILTQYQTQGNPVSVPFLGGAVIVDPRNPSKQQFIPQGEWSEKKLGDMSSKVFRWFDPSTGGIKEAPVTFGPATPTTPGPRSDAGPAAAPAAAPQGFQPAGVGAGTITAQNAPAAPITPPEAPVPAPAAAPVQVASLDPAAGVAEAAAKQPLTPTEQKMMAMVKPGEETPAATPVAAATSGAPATNPLAKWAQATPPGGDPNLHLNGFSPQDTEDYSRKKAFDSDAAVNEEGRKKGVEFAAKRYDTFSTQAAAAIQQLPNLDLAEKLMENPQFYSGIASNEVTAWKKLVASLPAGLTSLFTKDAAFAAAPNEVFNKVISGSILGSMKTTLAGLGQVRIAEIELLKQANASLNNTPAANKALLTIAKNSLVQLDNINSLAQTYVSGGEFVDPDTGKVIIKANIDANGNQQQRNGLDAGFDKIARDYVKNHPTMTAEQVKNYENLFRSKGDEVPAKPAQSGSLPIELPAAAVGGLKQGENTTFKNGQVYTLGPDGKPQRIK